MLLAGWLAAQLNWYAEKTKSSNQLRFAAANNRKIDIELREQTGHPVGKVVLNSGGIEFAVAPAKCGDLLEVSRSGRNEKPIPQMMPAQSNDPADLISQELLRGGPHRIYVHAFSCIRELL